MQETFQQHIQSFKTCFKSSQQAMNSSCPTLLMLQLSASTAAHFAFLLFCSFLGTNCSSEAVPKNIRALTTGERATSNLTKECGQWVKVPTFWEVDQVPAGTFLLLLRSSPLYYFCCSNPLTAFPLGLWNPVSLNDIERIWFNVHFQKSWDPFLRGSIKPPSPPLLRLDPKHGASTRFDHLPWSIGQAL